jgi:Membrane-bound serine protease (ClpP class)
MYAIFGSHGMDHHGIDIHAASTGGPHELHAGDAHDSGPSVFNPIVFASALTAFGGAGLIGSVGLGFSTLITLLFSLFISFGIGAAVFFGVIKLIYSSQSNSNFSDEQLIDAEALVVTPIPEKGFGEIAFTAGGTRTTLPAHSMDGSIIEKGEKVMIRRIENRQAYVSRKIIIDDLIIEENKKNRGRINEQ